MRQVPLVHAGTGTIASLLYDRLALSMDRAGLLALAEQGHKPYRPEDLIKDPYVLEFTGLPQSPHSTESDLEQALMDRLQAFLLDWLVDLKVGRLTQQDIGQMLLYTGYYESEEMQEGENPPVGLILCTDKNDAIAATPSAGPTKPSSPHATNCTCPPKKNCEPKSAGSGTPWKPRAV